MEEQCLELHRRVYTDRSEQRPRGSLAREHPHLPIRLPLLTIDYCQHPSYLATMYEGKDHASISYFASLVLLHTLVNGVVVALRTRYGMNTPVINPRKKQVQPSWPWHPLTVKTLRRRLSTLQSRISWRRLVHQAGPCFICSAVILHRRTC